MSRSSEGALDPWRCHSAIIGRRKVSGEILQKSPFCRRSATTSPAFISVAEASSERPLLPPCSTWERKHGTYIVVVGVRMQRCWTSHAGRSRNQEPAGVRMRRLLAGITAAVAPPQPQARQPR